MNEHHTSWNQIKEEQDMKRENKTLKCDACQRTQTLFYTTTSHPLPYGWGRMSTSVSITSHKHNRQGIKARILCPKCTRSQTDRL